MPIPNGYELVQPDFTEFERRLFVATLRAVGLPSAELVDPSPLHVFMTWTASLANEDACNAWRFVCLGMTQ